MVVARKVKGTVLVGLSQIKETLAFGMVGVGWQQSPPGGFRPYWILRASPSWVNSKPNRRGISEAAEL